MTIRHLLVSATTAALFLVTSGCNFFEEPVQLDDLTPQAPAQPTATAAAPKPAPATQPVQAANTRLLPPAPAAQSAGGTYFTVALLEDLPDDATNIAVVHFSVTGSNRNTERDVAMCKALLETIPPTRIDQIPDLPGTVILWPVSSSNSDGTCIEMLTDYEPVDISNETAVKVNDSVAGPFLLTRNNTLRKRMIFDMSYRPRQSLKAAISEWQALLGSDPANWPPYRSSR